MESDDLALGQTWIERTLSVEQVVQFAGPWILGMTAAAFLPHIILNGFPWPESWGLFFARLFVFVLVYMISVVVHELLHIVGMFVFGRVPWRSIRVGHRISEGVVYVHTSEPMSARAYRGVLLLPGIVTGLLPAVYGIATGFGWITFYGWVMMTSAIGDIAVYMLMRDLPPNVQVQDHPSEVGVRVRED